jgi:hypothetical protein
MKHLLAGGLGMMAFIFFNLAPLPVTVEGLSISRFLVFFGMPSLAALSITSSLSSERILGMQPLTFFCLAIPIVVQVAVLLIWAIKWRAPD